MPSPFLLEILTEDLPARVVSPTSRQLRERLEETLNEARLAFGEIAAFGTNRRFGILIHGLAEKQEEFTEELTGPPAKAAFGPDGKPTATGIKFAEGKGGRAEDLRKVSTPKGEYAAVTVKRGGKRAAEILAEACPKILASLEFPVTMRWGSGDHSFVRPVLSMVALFGKEVVPFSFCGISSGKATRGHRFLASDKVVEIPSADAYFDAMRKAFVEPDMDARRKAILAALETKAKESGGNLIADEKLLDTVAASFEWPRAFLGSFDAKYLTLPREVLISSMREHQKYFAVEKDGKLLPHFLTVMEVEESAAQNILAYHAKTLRSRLDDAAFFYAQDRKEKLETRLEKLKDAVFHEKVGTYYDKAMRLEKLAPKLAEIIKQNIPDFFQKPNYEETVAALRRAARLCKCDLATAMVYEFPSLQGVMGGIYAREEGEKESVWKAIYAYYQDPNEIIGGHEGQILGLADRLDTLAGFLKAGVVPSGSKDPYGLRRAGNEAVDCLRVYGLPLHDAVHTALETHGAVDDSVKALLGKFLIERFENALPYANIANAVLGAHWPGPLSHLFPNIRFESAEKRGEALERMEDSADLKALAVAFKRVKNLLKQAEEKGIKAEKVDAALLKERSEDALHKIIVKMRGHVEDDVKKGDYETAFKRLASMRVSVDQFFTDVMVMCEDETLKKNRVALVRELHDLFMSLADISALAVSTKEGA